MTQSYYVDIQEAARLLRERQSARSVVEEYWKEEGAEFPDEFRTLQPSALFARQLVTWRLEDSVFANLAQKARLQPVWMPYSSDKYTDVSTLKRSYTQPRLVTGTNKVGELINRKERLIKEPKYWSGRPLNHLKTDAGQPLQDWHFERWKRFYGQGNVIDATPWKQAWGGQVKRDYLGFMSLAIAHGVLFEDYHGGESGNSLDSFTADVFEPAFEAVTRRFGVKPLIVQMPWSSDFALYPTEQWLTQVTVQSLRAA